MDFKKERIQYLGGVVQSDVRIMCEECEWQELELPLYLAYIERVFLLK